jgi:thiamine kinase-like enzyme
MSEVERHALAEVTAEVPLAGGRLTTGVVRVGDTVRRPAGKHSEFVASLLRRLEELRANWAPRYLGTDELRRDVLSYVPGAVPSRWGTFSDQHVMQAARLLRAFHDATRASTLAGASQVVCHNDFGPNNAVFVDGAAAGMIDFDMAAPGGVLEDLGYTAWSWCISSKSGRPSVDVQASQVRILSDAYGGLDRATRSMLVDAVLERQERNACFWCSMAEHAGAIATPAERIPEMIRWSRQEGIFVRTHRHIFEAALL